MNTIKLNTIMLNVRALNLVGQPARKREGGSDVPSEEKSIIGTGKVGNFVIS
jgi:hypothetical protein